MKKCLLYVMVVSFIGCWALLFYSCYLRFTTQEEYFTWIWNASSEVQYVTGWAVALGLAFYGLLPIYQEIARQDN